MFAGVVITAPISGANLNPAVTIGLFAAGRVKLIRAILYIIVQCAGGIGKLVYQNKTMQSIIHSGRPKEKFSLSAESRKMASLKYSFLPKYRKNRKRVFLPKWHLSAERGFLHAKEGPELFRK